jgi:hypothetical protein
MQLTEEVGFLPDSVIECRDPLPIRGSVLVDSNAGVNGNKGPNRLHPI